MINDQVRIIVLFSFLIGSRPLTFFKSIVVHRLVILGYDTMLVEHSLTKCQQKFQSQSIPKNVISENLERSIQHVLNGDSNVLVSLYQ